MPGGFQRCQGWVGPQARHRTPPAPLSTARLICSSGGATGLQQTSVFPRVALPPTPSVGIWQGVRRVGSIPGHCRESGELDPSLVTAPATAPFPGIYPWEAGGSHLWKGEMPERPGSVPPIVINSSAHTPGAATSCVHISRLTGCSGLSPSTLLFTALSCCEHVQDWDNQKLAIAQPSQATRHLKSTAQV